jgi:hypothetical protein
MISTPTTTTISLPSPPSKPPSCNYHYLNFLNHIIDVWHARHPKMYPFFGFNRTQMYEESYIYPPQARNTLRQVQAGLLFVDAANTTMRDTFFTEWAACADNYDCLIPDNIQISKQSKFMLSEKYTVAEYNNARVFRYQDQGGWGMMEV